MTADIAWFRRGFPRVLLVLGVLAGSLVLFAAPARAHSGGAARATNFRATVTGMLPAADGIALTPVDNGSQMKLTVSPDRTVMVAGYNDEPYLRVDPTGVWQNSRSSATYLNRDRSGSADLPRTIDDSAPPDWQKISDDHTVAWHDHRTHWMGTQEPPAVQTDPGRMHRISIWTIPLVVNGTQVIASGTLDWVPGPSPVPWLALTTVVAVGIAALGIPRRGPTPTLGLAAAVVALVAVDITHSALVAAARADGWVSAFLGANIIEMVVWALGLGCAVLVARGSTAGRYLAATVAFVIAVVGGLADAGVLYRSGAAIAGPLTFARLLTVLTIGIGFGLLAAAAAAGRRRTRTGE